jgi:single-strand DNA-binding protein
MNVTLLGRLGADPTPATRKDGSTVIDKNGNMIVNFSLAEPNSRDRDQTNWHQCTILGKQADLIARTVRKGDRLLVEGNLDYETYTDKDGNLRTAVRITVRNFTYVETKRDSAPVDQAPSYQEATNF